jgi:hypothetical protein
MSGQIAARRSRRMGAGRLEQLLTYGDRTAVRRCVDSFREDGVELVAAVVAPREDLRDAFDGLPVRLVESADPEAILAPAFRGRRGHPMLFPRSAGANLLVATGGCRSTPTTARASPRIGSGPTT